MSVPVSVVVPAHDEGPLVYRVLAGLLTGAAGGELEVVVVANGCSDDTAERARAVADRSAPAVQVVELPEPSKVAALSAGLARATGEVVAVVDADVVLDWPTLRALTDLLRRTAEPRVGAPSLAVDTTGCSWPVRSYYRVWTQLPYVRSGMVGSGVFALNAAGRARLGELPAVLNDDAWVRRSFAPDERITGPGSFTVFAARSVGALVRRRARVDLGNRDLDRMSAPPAPGQPPSAQPASAHRPAPGNGLRAVVASARRREVATSDAVVFLALSLAARALGAWRRRRGSAGQWSQDRTTRGAGSG